MKWFRALTVIAFVAQAACQAKVNVDGGGGAAPADPGRKPKVSAPFKLGGSGAPGVNRISFGEEIRNGGEFAFEGTAQADGILNVYVGSYLGVDCDVRALPLKVFWVTSGSTPREVALPLEQGVRKEEQFQLLLELGPNSCQALTVDLMAVWTPDQGQSPQPPGNLPSPVKGPGFLFETELKNSSGSILIQQPTENFVYADFWFSVTSPVSLYQSAAVSSSNCEGPIVITLELLQIGDRGEILSRIEIRAGGEFLPLSPEKFYRVRMSISGVRSCRNVSEGFALGFF